MAGNEQLRQAIEWIGRQGKHDPDFIEFAARQFDLGPRDEQLLFDQFATPRPAPLPKRSTATALVEYSFLKVFANDGTIDEHELQFMTRLALRDGPLDDAERRVLSQIFGRISEPEVTPQVWSMIQQFKREQAID